MSPKFDIVTIVGTGLLGGSLGLALKKRGLVSTIRGVGRNESTLEQAKSVGAIDESYLDIKDAAIGANLIVLCTPAGNVTDYMDKIRPLIAKDVVVTDVASTKAEICAHTCRAWSEPYRFIGSHPMAGSEKYGPEHADADLYEGAVTFVEKLDEHDESAHETIVGLWESVGSKVVKIDPEVHDALVARTSHLPHIMAAAVAGLLGGVNDSGPFIGGGFKDTTRIAEGRPELWRDICLTNASAIKEGLDEMVDQLKAVSEAIESGDGDRLDRFFEKGREARRRALDS